MCVSMCDATKLRADCSRIEDGAISLSQLTERYAGHLAHIMSCDTRLGSKLVFREGEVVCGEEVLTKTETWCEKTSSISFAIVDNDDTVIGSISLSHIHRSARSGRIGYWLTSDRWGRGATTAAFGLILGLEKRIGL